jgi:predicted Fe-Mo cluster-binding NifX family protein
MKICVPVGENKGMDSVCYGHFGSAPYFVIFDTEAGKLEVLDNGNSNHVHGQCNPVGTLMECGADCIIVAGMGARAVQMLQNANIRVYRAERPFKIGEMAKDVNSYIQREMTVQDSCRDHTCG